MNELIYIVVGSLIGGITFFIINKISNKKTIDYAKSSANKILNEARAEAENIKNNKILQAKEKFLELKSEHEKYILSKNAEHNDRKQNLKLKENEVNQKLKKI
jgi:ribonuclease Y